MTNEEAIRGLRNIFDQLELDLPCQDSFDIEQMAVLALEKQIPKKPWRQADDDTCVYYHYECPNCGMYMGHYHASDTYTFCPDCGQKIDWSESEEL